MNKEKFPQDNNEIVNTLLQLWLTRMSEIHDSINLIIESTSSDKELVEKLERMIIQNEETLHQIKEILVGPESLLFSGEKPQGMKEDLEKTLKFFRLSEKATQEKNFTFEHFYDNIMKAISESKKNSNKIALDGVGEVIEELKKKTPWDKKVDLVKNIIVALLGLFALYSAWGKAVGDVVTKTVGG